VIILSMLCYHNIGTLPKHLRAEFKMVLQKGINISNGKNLNKNSRPNSLLA